MAGEANRTLSRADHPKNTQEGPVGMGDPSTILLLPWHPSAELGHALGAVQGQGDTGLTFGADGEGGVPQALG